MPDSNKLTPAEERALMAAFENARAHEPTVSPELLKRIALDAANAVSSENTISVAKAPKYWPHAFFRHLGGIPGAAIMTACALFGVSLGYAGPDSLISATGLSDLAEIDSEFVSEIDAFQTTSFEFDESEFLQ